MQHCELCGTDSVQEVTRTREIAYMGHRLVIPNDRLTRCDSCGEEFYTAEQAKTADRLLIEARRRQEGLLSGAEVRALRQSFSMSQQQFESALGLGEKTLVRIENGKSVQSKALDNLFRLLMLEPDSLVLLSRLREQRHLDLGALPLHQSQLSALESAIYARIEATDAVDQDMVHKVTRAVMDAYGQYKEDRISELLAKDTVVA
jgi:HTH-type transcriptional regulator/antitoxin MqsA